jgi:16S rRNA (cytosine1407-C5)-methyltransferase
MRAAMPAHLSFDDFIAACQRPLRRSIRVNTLKISVDDFLSGCPLRLAAAPVPWCEEGFWIEREDDDALPLGSTAEHLSGLFYIQEASSMLPVAALFADNRQPERVMDVAAARDRKPPKLPPEWATRAAFSPMNSPPAG